MAILKGNGPPPFALGSIEDLYFAVDVKDIYRKTDKTTWEFLGNYSGEAGIAGVTLQPDNGTSPVGDLFSITSSDGTIDVTGDAGTDTLDLNVGSSVALKVATGGGTGQSSYAQGDLLYASAADTLAKLGIGGLGKILTSDGATPSWQYLLNLARLGDLMYDDLTDANAAGRYLTVAASGTGAGRGAISSTENNHLGLKRFFTGTTATGYSGTFYNAAGPSMFTFGGALFFFETVLKPLNLSTGTERFSLLAGFGNNPAGGNDVADGVYFKYSDNNNNGNWELVASNNSVRSQSDTGVAAVADWVRLGILINAAGTSAQAFIDGVAAGAPITTNLPVGRFFNGSMFQIAKSVGTTSREFYLDAWGMLYFYDPAR